MAMEIMISGFMSEERLIENIKAHIERGDKAKDKSEQHYISAGQHLKALKETYHTWKKWEMILKRKVHISTGRASELMQIADGRKTVSELRSIDANKHKRLRSSGRPEEKRQTKRQNGLTQEMIKTWDEILESAQFIINARATWTKKYRRWKQFEVTSDMVTLAKRATKAWEMMANDLKRRVS
jgi:hypothetical protein